MDGDRKIIRAARKRAARRQARIRVASFGAGALVTLIVGIALLLNGQAKDAVVPATSIKTAAPTIAAEEMLAPTVTSSPILTAMPSLAPTLLPEPEIPDSVEAKSPDMSIESKPEYTVTLNVKDKVTMDVGETGEIRVKLDPSDSSAVLTWKSSNEKIIKVNKKGAVKAVAAGTAEVSLYINDSEEPAATVAIKAEKKSSSQTVWIPKTGKKYHSSKNCSNMKNPKAVTLSYAKSHGYGECSKCW